MMKFIKKTISALLASIICIPTGILNIANATEMESNGEYTVTLTDTVNGTMQFSETCMESSTATQDGYRMVQINEDGELVEIENDGSLWAFMQGDNVEIELVPDEGYKISSFTIKNASTGKVMAHKDTEDNVFSFSMPGKSVTVEAVFAQKLSVSDGEENIEETNIIAENENGDIVYQRIELVDDEAADLQERINNLPIPDDLYADFFSGEDGKIAAIEEEADQISDIYFNIFSDEQRAQIDPSLLFSTLLILRASDNVTTYDLLLDDSELAVLQDRINALNSPSEVATVAEFVEDEEFDLNYANYEYSNTDADMLITNRTQDELFLEVLDLSTTVFSLDFDQRMELDINPLDDMFRFFTMGHGESGDEADGESVAFLSKLFQTAYADAGDTEGRYNHTFYEAYKSSFFVGSTLDGDSGLTAYCGDANVSAFSHSGVPVNFSGSQELMAGDNTLNIQMARAVLYYGFDGPGQSEGIDAIVRTFPKISTIQCEGKRIQGMDVQKYMVTHFTLSYAWSGNIGNAPDTAPEYIDFYDFCYAHRFDVPSEFQCFVIVPQEDISRYFTLRMG